jgi:calcium-dependent protein kinase
MLQPYYISPEVLKGSYTEGCDLWSAGCLLYIILCGYPPFLGNTKESIYQSILTEEFDFDGIFYLTNFTDEVWDMVSVEGRDLIKNLLCP